MRERDDEGLPRELERAAELLRDAPVVRPEWRDALLDDVAHMARDEQRPRRIQLTTPMAIAAGIVCAIGGAGLSFVATHRGGLSIPTALQQSASRAATGKMLPVRFSVVAPEAARVSIVGDFNQWNPTTLPMSRSADGRHWEVEVKLPLGHYSYAFLIDGKISPDPAAPLGAGDDFGAPNSVLMVRGS
jgi:hypothetical protein